jgi:carboxymethylenebutenolidase
MPFAAVQGQARPASESNQWRATVTELQRYLAEEIATDHADGIISRREALRRLGLLGVSMAAAASLLAAFVRDEARANPSATGAAEPTAATSGEAAPVPTRGITFRGPRGRRLMGAWAPARQARGGVLVVHENRGLNDHTRSVAGRFAASGYSALAIDLLSEEGGTGSFADESEAMAALGAAPPARFVADMKAGVTELRRRLPGKKLAAVGFCFGGGMVWLLLASREPRLAAAVPFYGPFPEGGTLSGSKAAVLGIYAEQDSRVNATRGAARAALRAARLQHQIVTFPGADHAFFNNTGPRFNPTAAAEAYRRVLSWFMRYIDMRR